MPNTILERVLKIKSELLTREEWNTRKQEPHRALPYEGRKPLWLLIEIDRRSSHLLYPSNWSSGIDYDDTVADLFTLCLKELGMSYGSSLLSTKFVDIDNHASYDEVEQLMNLVVRYAENWIWT